MITKNLQSKCLLLSRTRRIRQAQVALAFKDNKYWLITFIRNILPSCIVYHLLLEIVSTDFPTDEPLVASLCSPDDLASRGINSSDGSLWYLNIRTNIAEITKLTLNKLRLHMRKSRFRFVIRSPGAWSRFGSLWSSEFQFQESRLKWNPGQAIRENQQWWTIRFTSISGHANLVDIRTDEKTDKEES